MQVNVSRIQDFLLCPRYEHQRWRLRRGPRFEGVGINTGLAWHAALAVLLEARRQGLTPDFQAAADAADHHFASLDWDSLPDDARKKMEDDQTRIHLLIPHALVVVPLEWEILEVEKSLGLRLHDHVFVGRPDTIVRHGDSIWHLQHKTTGGSVSWPLFERSVQRSFHENLYLAMLAAAYPEHRIAGTILYGMRKLGIATIKKSPLSALHVAYIPLLPRAQDLALSSLGYWADRIEAVDTVHRAGIPCAIPENRSACLGAFHNHPCPYLNVCDDRVSLDAADFKDIIPDAAYQEEPHD